MHVLKGCVYVLVAAIGIATAYAQDNAVIQLSLEDMAAFKPQAGNWLIVGDVAMDPAIDIHHQHSEPAEVPGKKNKKSKSGLLVELPKAVTYQSGKGILLNMNDATKKDNLLSAFEHGDIELELEVMIPKGSNSGIYLQGRYEVQLFDSWGVRNPKYIDMGGIFRNWENEKDKIYMGKAPLSNPAKAAGLWQKMKIAFRAPRFDAIGKKITNARFISVELNGVRIHDNVEVPLPTGGPIQNNEVAFGPLMIQGDHGPVAFRNIQYKLMKELTSSLSNISYQLYHGNFKVIADFTSLKPVASGSIPELTCEVVDVDNAYGVTYAGNITVPENGKYEFTLAYTGGSRLVVNGQQLLDRQRPDDRRVDNAFIDLQRGTYPFEIYNYKDASWMPPRLGFAVQTAASYRQNLHAFNSFPPDEDPVSAILIKPGSEPKLLRAFVDFKGDRKQRLTHTIGVGEPSGINYVYDLEAGNLVCVWRGDFVDATPMWHDRGDGSFHPLGAVQYLFVNQPLAFLSSLTEAFPLIGKEGEYKAKGYEMGEDTQRPVFKYIYKGLEVEDKVYPEDNNRMITHEIVLKNDRIINRGEQPTLYYKLAEGSSIQKMPNGSYAVDDKQYYLKVVSATQPVIREVNGKKELIVFFEGSTVKYSIIW